MSRNFTSNGDIANTLLSDYSCNTSCARGHSAEDLPEISNVGPHNELSPPGNAISHIASNTLCSSEKVLCIILLNPLLCVDGLLDPQYQGMLLLYCTSQPCN